MLVTRRLAGESEESIMYIPGYVHYLPICYLCYLTLRTTIHIEQVFHYNDDCPIANVFTSRIM